MENEKYKKIINNVNKYYYFIINKNKIKFLSSSNDIIQIKKDVLNKLKPVIENLIGKKLIFIKVKENEIENDDFSIFKYSPIYFEVLFGNIINENKIVNKRDYGNNKIYLTNDYIEKNKNNITKELKKILKLFLEDIDNRSFIDFFFYGNPDNKSKNENNKLNNEDENLIHLNIKNNNNNNMSKIDKRYQEIFNNPKIPDKSKATLKRGYDKGIKMDMEDLDKWEETELFLNENSDTEEEVKPKKEIKLKKEVKPIKKEKNIEELKEVIKKLRKEKNIMKGRSDLKKVGNKYSVDTELNIRKGLEPKVKRALKTSVINELDKKIKGSGIRNISSSEDEDIDEYKKLLKHFLSHILDSKEKSDIRDVKQAKELIDKINEKKKVYKK